MIVDYVDRLGDGNAKIDPEKVKDVLQELKEAFRGRDLPIFAARAPEPSPHADVVWALSQASSGVEPVHVHIHVYKRRTRPGTFPTSFPGMEAYARGFGPELSPEWLKAHVPEYSGVTFRTHGLSGDPTWDEVDAFWEGAPAQGPACPGTMLLQRPHRLDVCPQVGIVVGARPAADEVDVMWGPWTFRKDPT